MINKSISVLLVLIVGIVGFGCKKTNQTGPLGVATLVFPNQNSACTTGANVSDQQSSIIFTWSAAANAIGYEVHLKNLLTNGVNTYNINTNEATLILERNTPYSWYVISKSAASTTSTETWKFYNSGLSIVSHAPFPADVVAPIIGQNVSGTKVNLSWLGSDVDHDILSYDVFFGSTTVPPLFKSDVTSPLLNDVNVTAGVTYYWKIITKDVLGNTSNSALFQFKAN